MDLANSIDVVLFFLPIISTNFNIIVDRMIGAPEHGTYVTDCVNSYDKR